MFRFAPLVALVAFASACNPPGFINRPDGDDIRIQSGAYIPVSNQNGDVVSALVMLSDKPDLCRSLRSSRMPKKMEGVMFELVRVSDRAVLAPDTGEYTIITSAPARPGSYVAGEFMKFDSNCTNTLTAQERLLRSGYVEIDELETGRDGFVSGTFEVTYGSGDEAFGGFTAEYCILNVGELNCQ